MCLNFMKENYNSKEDLNFRLVVLVVWSVVIRAAPLRVCGIVHLCVCVAIRGLCRCLSLLLSSLFFETRSHWTWNSLASKSPSPPVSAFWCWITGMCHPAWPFTWVLGPQILFPLKNLLSPCQNFLYKIIGYIN